MTSTSPTTAPPNLARRAAASAPRFVRRRGQLLAGALIVGLFYLAALGADFLAPYDYRAQSRGEPLAPPTAIHWREAGGAWHARPFIHPRRLLDPLARTYAEDATRRSSLALLTHGDRYRLFGIIDTDLHLFGVTNEEMYATAKMPRLNLLGTDALGRDRLSQLLVAARFSLVVGLLGTLAAGALGVFIGCVAGYAGRSADALLMRAADAMLALPDLVLILAARAAFPPELPPLRAGGLLVGIFVAVGWAGVARLTRGLVLAMGG